MEELKKEIELLKEKVSLMERYLELLKLVAEHEKTKIEKVYIPVPYPNYPHYTDPNYTPYTIPPKIYCGNTWGAGTINA